jgi:hypothetical protein
MAPEIEMAILFAKMKHEGMVDKAGEGSFSGHLTRVAGAVSVDSHSCEPPGPVREGSYREIWGVMVSPTEMDVSLFSVVRDGCLSDRGVVLGPVGRGKRKYRRIKLRPTDRLAMVGMRRYPNP